MKFIVFLAVAICTGCSATPLLIEDVKELFEIEAEKEIDHDLHSKRETALAYGQDRWYWTDTDESVDEETKKERIQIFEDYYRYHFGDHIYKKEYALRIRPKKWPWGVFCYDEFDDWHV